MDNSVKLGPQFSLPPPPKVTQKMMQLHKIPVTIICDTPTPQILPFSSLINSELSLINLLIQLRHVSATGIVMADWGYLVCHAIIAGSG